MTDRSDESLLAAHLRGDPAAFAELVGRHDRRIYGLCLRILGNREDAEDAAQEAFLSALRKAGSFRRAAAFSTWLYRIAVNAATDQARRRGRARLTALDPEDAGVAVAPGGELGEVVSAAVTVQAALAQVPEEFRVAVVLCDLYRLPYADAAQILEVPVGTVKSRVFRGRLALADRLGNASDTPEPQDAPAAQDPAGPVGPHALQQAPAPRDASARGDAGGRGSEAERPPLRVVGAPGTESRSAASDPREADRPNQE